MFGHRIQESFVNDVKSADRMDGSKGPGIFLVLIAIGIGSFLFWAWSSEIEQFSRGSGQVVPSSKTQIVQSLEGGIVGSIEVAEGDFVERGDVILQIDDTHFESQMGELTERRGALLAERVRLLAESNMRQDVEFPEDVVANNPLATSAEMEVFFSRRQQLDRELGILNDKLLQRRSELAELDAQQLKRRKMMEPLAEEIVLTEQFTLTGAVPRIELLRLQSRMAELEGNLAVDSAAKERLQAAIDQAEKEINIARSGYALTARQRLAVLQLELAVVNEVLKAASDRVERTQIRAPTRGTVNALGVTTVGAVVSPGQPLAEIVPADDGLLIEVNLRPADVAFVTRDAQASVKITAYDYLIYGALPGHVERIGADTITSKDGEEFFRVVIRTDRNFVGSSENPLPISPGMVASVDIRTGQTTVLDYLLKPILRARTEALRER